MEKKNDEIDLLELFFRLVNILRANFWLIVSFFLIGAAIGSVSYFTARKVFQNKMVISSAILTKSYAEVLIDKLNKYLNENNKDAVGRDLELASEIVRGIKQLKVESLTVPGETKENDKFIIIVETFNREILPELQQGLISYLEKNEFVKVRVEHNKNYFKQMIVKVEAELKDMEEWKQKIMGGAFFQSVKGNVMFDPTAVNSKILELTKEKINLENSLALANSVQVIEGFTNFKTPSSPRLSVSLISGSLIGLVFVSLLIAFKSIRKLLKMADAAKATP